MPIHNLLSAIKRAFIVRACVRAYGVDGGVGYGGCRGCCGDGGGHGGSYCRPRHRTTFTTTSNVARARHHFVKGHAHMRPCHVCRWSVVARCSRDTCDCHNNHVRKRHRSLCASQSPACQTLSSSSPVVANVGSTPSGSTLVTQHSAIA